jgi:glycosyltransferase 2 family protein
MKIFNIKINSTRTVFLLLGIIIIVIMFRSFGIEKFLKDISLLGWGFALLVALYMLNHIFLTYAWKVLINFTIPLRKFFKLVLARIAGDSTSSINALGAIAGEPIKALFMKDDIPLNTGLASVFLDRIIHSLANTLVVLTGIIISFFVLSIPVWITTGFLLLISTSCVIIIILLRRQRNGFIEFLINKIPKKFSSRFLTEFKLLKIKEIDKEITFILSGKENLKRFYVSLFVGYFSILTVGTLEVYLIIKFTNINISVIDSMFVYVFSLFITSTAFFIPANIGTSEVSYSLALKFLEYDPRIGLTVGIIRRLRSFVWAGIGMLILFYGSVRKEKIKADEQLKNI